MTTDPNSHARAQFDSAVRPHVDAMHACARRILGAEDLAWDAVQETLLRAWTWDSLPEDPRRVLIALVRRSALHQLRCARRRGDHEATAAADRHQHCCPDDPLINVADGEARERIGRAIARLADQYRSVVEIVGIEGDSYQNAASRLRIPIGTVRSRASRARERLKEAIGSDLDVA